MGDGHRPVGIYDVAPRLRRQTDDRRANEQRSIGAKKGKTVVSARCDRRSSAEDTTYVLKVDVDIYTDIDNFT